MPFPSTCLQDPFKTDNKLHSELANVSRVWPSVSRDSRMSELRMRSTASRTSATSAGSGKGDVLGHHMPHQGQAGRMSAKHLDTVYSVEPTRLGSGGVAAQGQDRV
jgi:hypothetical protein